MSKRGKDFSIYRNAADGTGEARRVLGGTGTLAPTDVSGHTLIFQDQGASGVRQIMTFDLDAEGPARPLFATPDDEAEGRVSPSGKWIAYSSVELAGSQPFPKIYVRPFPNAAAGGQRVISEGFGMSPVWSQTGDEIYYLEFEGTGPGPLISVPVAVTPTSITPAGRHELFGFTAKFDIRYGSAYHTAPFDVMPKGGFVAAEAGVPQSPGGAQGSPNRPHINVVLNWLEELKRAVPAQ